LIVIGCGGGGGGGTSSTSNPTTSNPTGGNATDLRIYAPVGNGVFTDPGNVAVGETLDFNVYGLNSNRNVVSVSASNWTTDAPPSVATVDANGVVSGVSASDGSYGLGATAQTTTLSSALKVRPAGARVTGTLTTGEGTGSDPTMPLAGGIIVFYNESGTLEVGRAVTAHNGTFRAVVPTTARRFTVQISDSSAYHKTFSVGSSGYVGDESTCYAPLPTLNNGATSVLPARIQLYRKELGPPPPPSGCLE
jgi:hypothetical protein